METLLLIQINQIVFLCDSCSYTKQSKHHSWIQLENIPVFLQIHLHSHTYTHTYTHTNKHTAILTRLKKKCNCTISIKWEEILSLYKGNNSFLGRQIDAKCFQYNSTDMNTFLWPRSAMLSIQSNYRVQYSKSINVSMFRLYFAGSEACDTKFIRFTIMRYRTL